MIWNIGAVGPVEVERKELRYQLQGLPVGVVAAEAAVEETVLSIQHELVEETPLEYYLVRLQVAEKWDCSPSIYLKTVAAATG